MPRQSHPEFKRAERELRKAARRVAAADGKDLLAAVKVLGHAENNWQSALPRDGQMQPLPGLFT